jgi:AcrR family transcriptional regulator
LPTLSPPVEKPRKQPVQQRSAVTVDAILAATIQVLIRMGKEKLTTTHVARRAGVSVGTLYQYFPNKRSLLQAVLRKHLNSVTEAFESACLEHRGKPLADMVAAIAAAFFRTKMVEPRASLALYSVSADIDGLRITEDLRRRNETAFEAAIATAPESVHTSRKQFAFAVQSAMIGITRRILEGNIPAHEHEALLQQTIAMLRAYAESVTR